MKNHPLVRLNEVGVQASAANNTADWLLMNISTHCYKGERIGLMGRNGSGKTTLARLLTGLDRPTTGEIIVSSNERVLLVLQRPEDQFISHTVGQQIMGYARKTNKKRVEEVLEQVGLTPEIAACSPRQLSTGQQRLVSIACSLITEAALIVLDEPMAGLDQRGKELVKKTLMGLGRILSRCLIIISHHPDDLFGLVERLWILDQGRLLYDGRFRSVSVRILDVCLSSKDVSLYYALRKAESEGIALPDSIYDELNLIEIARILTESS